MSEIIITTVGGRTLKIPVIDIDSVQPFGLYETKITMKPGTWTTGELYSSMGPAEINRQIEEAKRTIG